MSGGVVDEYLATLPEPQRTAFERISARVRETVPEVEQATSYGIPAFTYRRRPLLGLRASAAHLSVYPFSPEAIEAARDALAGFDVSKGTVRFTPERPLPDEALDRLLGHRKRELDGN